MEKIKNILKNKRFIIFMISVIISLIVYQFFLTGYYSYDTNRICSEGWIEYATTDAYIKDGRPFSALIFTIIGLINPSIKTEYIINLVIAIIILSIAVVVIYELIERYKKLSSKKEKVIAFLLSYTFIFNFITLNIMVFVDAFMICASILLFIIAVKEIIINDKKIKGAILTILGVLTYQGTIPVYIATAIFITLLENKKINKEYFKRILPCAISIIIAGIISLVIVNVGSSIIQYITGIESEGRLSGINLINNIKINVISIDFYIKDSFYLFPEYLWLEICIVTLVLGMIIAIKQKNAKFMINIIFLFVAYICCFLIMFPIAYLGVLERTALSWGEVVSVMLIYIFIFEMQRNEKESNILENILIMMALIYFVITSVTILKCTYDYKLANKLDQGFYELVNEKKEELENENGTEIEYAYVEYAWSGKKMNYSNHMRSSSMYLQGIYSNYLSELYTGESGPEFIDTELPLEVQEYFEEVSSREDEEVYFYNIDDVLYIYVDL